VLPAQTVLHVGAAVFEHILHVDDGQRAQLTVFNVEDALIVTPNFTRLNRCQNLNWRRLDPRDISSGGPPADIETEVHLPVLLVRPRPGGHPAPGHGQMDDLPQVHG